MQIAEFDGGKVSYEITGSGAPVVLLLPQSTGPSGRQAFIDALAQHHAVLTYDQRGTGASSPAPADISMPAQAADVLAVLDAIGFEQVSLIGHSTGCGIALSLAASNPERVRAMVLATPWTYADAHLSTMQNLRITAARALDPLQYQRFNAALLFPPQFRRAEQAGFDRLAAAAVHHPQDADEIARRLNAILAFDARPLLPTIRCPTLVAVAKDDQLMPVWFAAEAAANIKGGQYLEFDAGGHMLLETCTEEFVCAALAFFAKV
jgi:aminoacrylate hydrolase